jgi:LPS export ABC transporter protein LptC
MHTRLRRFVIVTVVLLLVGGGTVLVRTLWRQREAALEQQLLDLLPEVAQRIQDFHRVKVEDGRKVWEVAAREAQYYEAEGVVVVYEPLVSFYGKDGREVGLRGREGKVFLGGHDLDRVELNGDIRVSFGDYAFATETARYERSGDHIVAPGAVEITGRDFAIHGAQLRIHVPSQRLTLGADVRMTLHPQTS